MIGSLNAFWLPIVLEYSLSSWLAPHLNFICNFVVSLLSHTCEGRTRLPKVVRHDPYAIPAGQMEIYMAEENIIIQITFYIIWSQLNLISLFILFQTLQF